MKEYWSISAKAFNQRNFRERILIAFSLFALVYLVWDFLFLSSAQKKQQALSQRYEAVSKDMLILTSEQKVLLKALQTDPLAEKKREVVRLEQEISVVDSELDNLSLGLVPAEKLAKILYDVLQANHSAKLIELGTQKPSLLRLSPITQNTNDQDQIVSANSVGIYKNSVVLEIHGKYFDVVTYLEALEGLDWRFYWESLEYEVERYPHGKAILEVFTLSTDRGAIGV